MRFNTFHIFPDGHYLVYIHGVFCQSVFLQQLTELLLVQRVIHHLPQPGSDFRVIAIADSFD